MSYTQKPDFNELLLKDLQRHEGLRLKPYHCSAGKLTIGYGRNLDDMGITKEEARLLLMEDVFRVKQDVKRELPWVFHMSGPRQNVVFNMCYNIGINRLLGFKKTLDHMREGRYLEASIEMMKSEWASQVGNRARELSNQMRIG